MYSIRIHMNNINIPIEYDYYVLIIQRNDMIGHTNCTDDTRDSCK